jgi:chromate transport protein ChrA
MPQSEASPQASAIQGKSTLTVFRVFLKLGLTSFGGPIAHLGYFREEFVNRRKWISDKAYADLVALCQFTPGPASSKIGIGIGLAQAGLPGAFAAWLGFTAPSALALILFGYGILALGDRIDLGWLHGMLVVAVPVVAQAVWGMARNLTPDALRVTLAALAAILVLIWPTPLGFIGAIVAGGIAGWPARSCSAAATSCCHYCKPRWAPRDGCRTKRSLRAMARRRLSRARCSPSPLISARSQPFHPTDGSALSRAWRASLPHRFCW